jgi:hypothetical protein
MDRLLHAPVLMTEAHELGVTVADLLAVAGEVPSVATPPTVAEYVAAITPALSEGTAATYRPYWRLAVARLGNRPVRDVDVDDCEMVVADAVARARRHRSSSDDRSSRETCIGALRALFARAVRAGPIPRIPRRRSASRAGGRAAAAR